MAVTEESFLSGNLSAQPAAPDGQKKESMLDDPEKSHPHWIEYYTAFLAEVRHRDPASSKRDSCWCAFDMRHLDSQMNVAQLR